MKHHTLAITVLACLLALQAGAEGKSQEELATRLPEIKQSLATGNSAERLETVSFLARNRSLVALMDNSFIDAWAACATDKNAKVRRAVASWVGRRWLNKKDLNAKAVELIFELSHDQDRQVRYNCVYNGLQRISDKSNAIVRRLIDIGIQSPYENNLYDVIGRGLSKNGEQAEKYLTPYLGEDNAHETRFRAFIMYTQFLRREPQDMASLSGIGEYVIIFTRERSDDPMGDIESILPSGIEPYHAVNIADEHRVSGVFKIDRISKLKSIQNFFGQNKEFRLYAIWPVSEFTLARIYRGQKPEYRIPAYAKKEVTSRATEDGSHRIVSPGENTLVGTWELSHGGTVVMAMTFDAKGQMHVSTGGANMVGSYTTDTGQIPAHIDTVISLVDGDQTARTIYEFLPNGNLRMARNGPGASGQRPDAFTDSDALVFTRKKAVSVNSDESR